MIWWKAGFVHLAWNSFLPIGFMVVSQFFTYFRIFPYFSFYRFLLNTLWQAAPETLQRLGQSNMSADYFLWYLGLAFLTAGHFVSLQSACLHLSQALSRASFWFHFLLECILFCTNVEAAKLHFLRRFSFWYVCFVFLQGSRRWTQKCDGRGCVDVGGWAFAQLHGACRVASSSGGRDERDDQCRAGIYIYISIHRRSLDLRLNLQHNDIWMDMQACHGSS